MRNHAVVGVLLLTVVIGISCGVECVMGASDGVHEVGNGWFAQVQEKIRKEEYQVTWRAKGEDGMPPSYQAPNRAQGLRTFFEKDGITIVSRTAKASFWKMSLRATGIGRGNELKPLPPAAAEVKGPSVTYRRGSVEEWYKNAPEGIEQGFTVKSRPKGSGLLEIRLALGPGWKSRVANGGIELSDPSGAARLTYGKLTVVDASGVEIPSLMASEGRVIKVKIDDSKAAYPIVVDPLISTPPWMVEGDQGAGMMGWAVSSAGDVNGDGYADVIVGQRAYDGIAGAHSGKVFVYHGSAHGPGTTPTWSMEGDQADGRLGWSVASAGDVNGDGFSDVIISQPDYFGNVGTDLGRVLVYHGSASGLGSTVAWSKDGDQTGIRLGYSVSSAGDVNADGFSDVIVGAPGSEATIGTYGGKVFVYYGSVSGLATSGAWSVEGDQDSGLGCSVSSAGDVNGDGFSDIVVGAPASIGAAGPNAGKAFVFHGSNTGPGETAAWSMEGDKAEGILGYPVSSVGDVNGDGFSDIIIGVPDSGATAGDHPGKVLVYHGSAAGLGMTASWIIEGDETDSRMGFSVSSAGDVNGDGFSDVVIGAHHCDETPCHIDSKFFVYHGSSSGLGTSAVWSVVCELGGYFFGKPAANAGDVNGDGYSDLIIGNPGYKNGPNEIVGAAYVYYGTALGLNQPGAWTNSGQQEGAKLGFAVAGVGDVNGDGYADLIVGAPYYDGGQVDQGRTYLFTGGPNGPVSTAARVLDGPQAKAHFGYSVAGAGDTNKDGYADIIVGAPHFDTRKLEDAGRVYIFRGSSAGQLATPSWTATGSTSGSLLGWSVAAAGDVNGDGFADVLAGAPGYTHQLKEQGAAYVFAGRKRTKRVLLWSHEGEHARGQFGYSVSGAGDVNRDGFDDLIIGSPFQRNIFVREGAAFIFHGASTGPGSRAARTLYGYQQDGRFGFAVSKAGDVNADGYSDVIVGAPYYWSNGTTGGAFVYLGSRRGIRPATVFSIYGQQSGENFGYSVSSAGDVDGDGLDDVIIGAPLHDDTKTDQGAAYILSYSKGSFHTIWSASGQQPGAYFGHSVSGAGDVNRDGLPDIAVGAPGLNADGIADGGEVNVYY